MSQTRATNPVGTVVSSSVPSSTSATTASAAAASTTVGAEAPAITTVKRVLHVHIAGSLTKLSQDGDAACRWKPVEGKQTEMFGVNGHTDIDGSDASNAIRWATLTEARLLDSHNGLPFNIGITVSGLPRDEVVDTGHRYTYTALANSRSNAPQTLFQADSRTKESQQWRAKYSKYNSSNLETEGVIEMRQCPYVFVEESHPVIEVLRQNAALIGTDIDKVARLDGYLKISRAVVSQCCQALRAKVLNNIDSNGYNLHTFSVAIERTGGQDWLDIGDGSVALASFNGLYIDSPESVANAQKKHLDNFIEREYSYTARLELTYELPLQQPDAVTAAPPS